MRAFLICLSLMSIGASAASTGRQCAPLFWPVSSLEPDAERAWVRVREGLNGLAQVDVGEDLFTWVRQKRLGHSTLRDGRALVTLPVSTGERAILCHGLTPLLLETNAAARDAELAFYLIDQLCESDRSEVLAVTEGVLRATDAGQIRRWLELVGHASIKNRDALLRPSDWRGLLTQSDSPVLRDFVRDHLVALGLDSGDLVALARRMLRAGDGVTAVFTQTGLDRARAGELIPDLDMFQWIEIRHRVGELNDAAIEIARGSELVRRRPSLTRVHQVLLALLYDERVPYATFERVLALCKNEWRATVGSDLPPLVFTPSPKWTAGQIERAERAFGRDIVHPDVVAWLGRRWARDVSVSLDRVAYDDADEFVDVFALARHTSFVAPGADGQYDPVSLQQVRAFANIYFVRLHRELPKFLKLGPDVAQVRWLLETPLQFAPAPIDRDHDRRPAWRRMIDVKPGLYDTAELIEANRHDALEWAMPRVTSLDEWRTLVLARRLPSISNAVDRRSIIARYIFEAARVGPADLSWLDDPLAREATEVAQTLGELRSRVRANSRADDGLLSHALETLLSPPAVDGPRVPVGRWRREEILLEYLRARGAAGSIAHVAPGRLARVRAIAFEHGFFVDEYARDAQSVALKIERRPR